jgi:Domain of unknown function (DUF1330)
MAAYYLFDNVEVSDPEALARYFPQAAKLVAEHGGRYLAVDAVPEVVEGDPGLTSVRPRDWRRVKLVQHRLDRGRVLLEVPALLRLWVPSGGGGIRTLDTP